MTDIQLYTKLSGLPSDLKKEVENFIEFLRFKNQNKEAHTEKRLAGKAKGFIKMKANFDDPIEGFNLNFK